MSSTTAQSFALRAHKLAVMELIKNHQDEWDQLYRGHRVSFGLPAAAGGHLSREKLQARIDRYEQLVAKAREELGQLS